MDNGLKGNEYNNAQITITTYTTTVLQDRINNQQNIQKEITRLEGVERDLQNKLSNLNQEIQRIQVNLTTTQSQQSSSRTEFVSFNNQIDGLNQRLLTITTQLNVIRTQISNLGTNSSEYQNYLKELQIAMVEKQLVDALVINMLIEAKIYDSNTVKIPITKIVTTGDSTINLNNLLSTDLYQISYSVESSKDRGVGLYRIPGPGVNSVSSPYVIDSEQCDFRTNSFIFGFGKITKIDPITNTFDVQENGVTTKTKFYTCSILLGSGMNYVPRVGDLLCYKALRGDNDNSSLVVIEALALHEA